MGFGITLRVHGDYALFTRPEMKVERMSYDAITPSAAQGILEAIYWKPAIRWVIDRLHVINEIEFTNIRRNEIKEKTPTGVVRQNANDGKPAPFIAASESRTQRAAIVLKNVDYVIEAHFDLVAEKCGAEDTKEKHYNMALRRLRKGQHFSAPCLGTREFAAKVEFIENESIPQSKLRGHRDLGWMLYDMDFSNPKNIVPKFFRAEMNDGIIDLRQVRLAG